MADEIVVSSTTSAAALAPAPRFAGQTYHAQSYYRSNLFTVETASCPLIQAALPLISLLTRLSTQIELADFEELHAELNHEINAFSCQLQDSHYPLELLIVSRYLLCVTFDYYISHLNMDAFIQWQKYLLVDSQQNIIALDQAADDFSHEQNFFKICESLIADPEEKEDVLELIYLCIIFGFKRIQQLSTTLHSQEPTYLDQLLDKLYQHIMKKRQNLPKLFDELPQQLSPYETIPKKLSIPRPLLITFTAVGAAITVYYFLLSHIFHLMMQPILQEMNLLN
jgi:type IV/VI secretion system ImpK/VasF family protein